MLEKRNHPISIPQEIWSSPYFHTSILGHGLSPYFQGPGCHPTSVGLFLFSLSKYYQVPNKRTGVRSTIFENLSWSTPYWGHCTQ